MTPEPIQYNYALLGKVVTGIVLLLVLVVFAITFKWWPRSRQRLRAWWRHQQGHVLPVLFLFATAGIGWLGVWAWWILTHPKQY